MFASAQLQEDMTTGERQRHGEDTVRSQGEHTWCTHDDTRFGTNTHVKQACARVCCSKSRELQEEGAQTRWLWSCPFSPDSSSATQQQPQELKQSAWMQHGVSVIVPLFNEHRWSLISSSVDHVTLQSIHSSVEVYVLCPEFSLSGTPCHALQVVSLTTEQSTYI